MTLMKEKNVGWGATAVDGFPGLKRVAFEQSETQQNQGFFWIRTYSSADFQPLAQQLETLVDNYATAKALVHSTYRYTMFC
jgi:thiaminase